MMMARKTISGTALWDEHHNDYAVGYTSNKLERSTEEECGTKRKKLE